MTFEELAKAQESDIDCQTLKQEVKENKNSDYILEGDVLYKKHTSNKLLVIPQNCRENILSSYHNDASLAHISSNSLYKIFSTRYFWPTMREDIKRWTSSCLSCNQRKPSKPNNHGLLQPIKVTRPFELVGRDILGPLVKSSDGYKYILVCIDYFTNWVEAHPLRTITAPEVCNAFYVVIISRHGAPEKVITDLGTQFTSSTFSELCRTFNIDKLESTAYHHQTNGKVERFNRFLLQAMSLMVNREQSNWNKILNNCLFTYRISTNRSIDETPFHMLYGRNCNLPNDLKFSTMNKTAYDNIEDYKTQQTAIYRDLYEKIILKRDKEQSKYKSYYDEKHKNVTLKVGDLVMVYWPSPKYGLSTKLLPRWQGPYKVQAQENAVSYRIDTGKTTLVIHVQRLRKYKPWK